MWRVGVDIGGAFTDAYALNEETGEFRWVKVETTPDIVSGVVEALKKLGIDMGSVRFVFHGQTVVINTIVTRTGARTALITTRGFRDILELQRSNRRDLYNLMYRKPEPLVPRWLRFEVEERVMYDGTVMTPLNYKDLDSIIERLGKVPDVSSVAISYINSYANPKHEIETEEYLKEHLKGKFISRSSALTRLWREYERTSTVVLNAYVLPKFYNYVTSLEEAFTKMGFRGVFYIVLSNGGVNTSNFIKNYPIYTVEGGPISGVFGATRLGGVVGEGNLVVLDGGSTTTKASLVRNLNYLTRSEYYIGASRYSPGYPAMIPIIEVFETGLGGTSIAWIDEAGRLRVGPKAAGSYPGPACYGRGGTEPTLTDAYVITGFLNPRELLGGAIKVNRESAIKAVKPLADRLGLTVEETALGIIRLANELATNVIRVVSIQRGYDPREFALVAHGGAGPMFAPFIAEELNIKKIIVPFIPAGVFNAWGMLNLDAIHDATETRIMKLMVNEIEAKEISKIIEELRNKVMGDFKSEGIDPSLVKFEYYLDMRYYGQEYTLRVQTNYPVTLDVLKNTIKSFEDRHHSEYGFRLEGNPVEIVNFYVRGIYELPKPEIKQISVTGDISKALIEERDVYMGNNNVIRVPVYSKESLPADAEIRGPVIIEESTATIIVLNGWKAMKDRYGNIIMTKK